MEVEKIVKINQKNECKKFYKNIKEQTQEFKPLRISACKGKILTHNDDILQRWTEYFEIILSDNPDDTAEMSFSSAEPADTQPTYEEVFDVIKYLKNYKASESDKTL